MVQKTGKSSVTMRFDNGDIGWLQFTPEHIELLTLEDRIEDMEVQGHLPDTDIPILALDFDVLELADRNTKDTNEDHATTD